MGTNELLGKPNKLRESDLPWTTIPLHATETGISSGSYAPVGSKASVCFLTFGNADEPKEELDRRLHGILLLCEHISLYFQRI